METVKQSSNKEGKNLLAEFPSPSLETTVTTETPAIHCNCTRRKKKPHIDSK